MAERSPLITADVAGGGYPNVRLSFITADVVSGGFPTVKAPLIVADVGSGGYPNVRVPLIVAEILFPVPEGKPVSTDIFPGPGTAEALPGISFTVTKSPEFSTLTSKSVGGRQTRTAFYQFPVWHYKISFDYLPDQELDAQKSVQALMGFYMAHYGSWDTWLFWDPDDNTVSNGLIATADGVTTTWDFVRGMGAFYEPVGQLTDTTSPVVYFTAPETDSVPGTGPYQITVTHSAAFQQDLGVKIGGTPLTKVSGSPGPMQYSEAAGVYTFNSAQASASAVITYRYTVSPSAYTITLPNTLEFMSAPASGTIITADFSYYFVCHFEKDQMDFEKFANQLWQLQECDFESVIQ